MENKIVRNGITRMYLINLLDHLMEVIESEGKRQNLSLSYKEADALQACVLEYGSVKKEKDGVIYYEEKFDSVYRDDVIRAVENVFDKESAASRLCIRLVKQAIEKIPNVRNGWISLSDKVPEPCRVVIATNGYDQMLVGRIKKDKDGTYKAEGDEDFIYEVIAWMPLPEPYKDGDA